MERLTTELILPSSKCKVVIYNKLTHYESRQLAKLVVGDTEITINPETKKTQALENLKIRADINFQMEDMAVGFLLKEAYLEDGARVDNLTDFYRNLDQDDGQFLVDEINKATSGSQLSEESKKK